MIWLKVVRETKQSENMVKILIGRSKVEKIKNLSGFEKKV